MTDTPNHLNNFLAAAIETAMKYALPKIDNNTRDLYWPRVTDAARLMCKSLREPGADLGAVKTGAWLLTQAINTAVHEERITIMSTAPKARLEGIEYARAAAIKTMGVQAGKGPAQTALNMAEYNAGALLQLKGLVREVSDTLLGTETMSDSERTDTFVVCEVFNKLLHIAEHSEDLPMYHNVEQHRRLANTVIGELLAAAR